jgi:hypothetical protein
MKFAILVAALMSFGLAGFSLAADEAPAVHGPLYHVVSLKFKEGTTPEQIKAVEETFRELKTKIPGIQTLHWGTNVSPEKKNHGFTHCFVLTFANEKDRDAYLVDPAHKAFGKLAGPHFDDVFVFDFVAQN